MFWFIIPVLIVLVLIAVAVAVCASTSRRRVPDASRQAGETVYDSNDRRKALNAPPA